MQDNYPWIPAFVSALLEMNPDKLHERIADAYHAISKRLASHEPFDREECVKIADAKNVLLSLGGEDPEPKPSLATDMAATTQFRAARSRSKQ